MKQSNTKKSLTLSAWALFISIVMLIGTTFAWFTDSVTSGKNTIKAGNLDIELEVTTDGSTYTPVTGNTKLFNDDALWEPGHTEVAYLKLSNKGTLALKYQFAINIANEVAGTNVADESFNLSDYIKMGVVENWDGIVYADRAAAREDVTEAGKIVTYSSTGEMVKDADPKYIAIVVFMPEEVGNEANYKTGTTAPSIELGVNVIATQLTSEIDSFDNQYDKAAWIVANADYTAADASELKNALKQGGTVAVTKDITGDLTLDNLGDGAEVALAGTTVTGTVTAKDDITISGTGKITNENNGVALQVTAPSKIVTLDGASVVAGKSKAVDLSDNSKLVINSGSVERTEESSTGFNQLILANDDAEIEIGGGDFKHDSGNYATIVKFDDKGGKLEVTNGNFQAGNATGSHAKVVDLDSDVAGEINLKGGNFVLQGSHGAVVNGGQAGTSITIDGGNYKVGNVGYLVYSSTANVVINNCSYVSDMTGATGSPLYSYIFNVSGTAKVTVKGGNFTLDKNANTVRICSSGQDANVILEGGTFNVQPSLSATIAGGYHEVNNGNGTWSVVAN